MTLEKSYCWPRIIWPSCRPGRGPGGRSSGNIEPGTLRCSVSCPSCSPAQRSFEHGIAGAPWQVGSTIRARQLGSKARAERVRDERHCPTAGTLREGVGSDTRERLSELYGAEADSTLARHPEGGPLPPWYCRFTKFPIAPMAEVTGMIASSSLDDEPLARERLRTLVVAHADLAVVAECRGYGQGKRWRLSRH